MTTSTRRRRIVTLALPIIGGMASQNVLNLVDTAMVGVLGAASLAAVGMASFANFMASAFIMGLAAGVQAMAARRKGEGRADEMARPLNGGLALAVGLAVPWSGLLFVIADDVFPFLVDDPEVVALGVPYLRARLLAMTALGVNYAFRGYWNGVDRSTVYLRTIVTMHVCNVVLNWLLIFGHLGFPRLGVTGAGIASAISFAIGSVLYTVQGARLAGEAGFLRSIPDRATMVSMLRLSVPTGTQQFFFAAGMTTFFWIIGQIGTDEMAASNVLTNLLLVVILPGLGFGLAAMSLVGQALGRGDVDDAAAWPWEVARLAAVVVAAIASVGLVAPDLVLGLFLHEPDTLELARAPLRIIAATIVYDTLGTVLMHALLGAGDNRRVMMVAIGLQWGAFLPLAYLVGPVWGLGLTAVWIAQVVYRAVQTTVFIVMWRGRRWSAHEM
jgi:putative MATE family efflux protein